MARIAFLLDNAYEDSEMVNPYEAIKEAGHEAVIVGNEKGTLCEGKRGEASYHTEMSSKDAINIDFDGMVIPGGAAPEALRVHDDTVKFVQSLNEKSKLIAGICHGPQVMISADIIQGKELTCYVGIRDDVKNAGGSYVDQEVVHSHNIVTSRTPKDEPAFIKTIIEAIG